MKPCKYGHPLSDRIRYGKAKNLFCKGCFKARAAAKYAANPEKYRALTRAYYAANRAACMGRERKRRAANQELMRERQQAYDESHREERRAACRDWYKRNKLRAAELRYRRRGAVKAGDVDAAAWDALLAHYDHRCAYCSEPADRLEVDHVVPLAKGGAHVRSNVVPCCAPCNRRKNQKVWEPSKPSLFTMVYL
jgi:5-methylcytosine-specific restriction endonuclease McrA